VALAFLQLGLDHPHAVQFPTHHVRVDELGLEHVFRLVVIDEAVGVVRDVQLLLARPA
jgi:hypothetical protein